MSTTGSESFNLQKIKDQLPPLNSTTILCNPQICDTLSHLKPLSAEKFEEHAKKLYKNSKTGALFMVMQSFAPESIQPIAQYMKNLNGPDLFSSDNNNALETFQTNFKKAVSTAFNDEDDDSMERSSIWYFYYLSMISSYLQEDGGVCLASLKGSKLQDLIRRWDNHHLLMVAFQQEPYESSLQRLKSKGFTTSNVTSFKNHLIAEICTLFVEGIENTVFRKWMEFVEDSVLPSRCFKYGQVFLHLVSIGAQGVNIPLPHLGIMKVFWEMNAIGALPTIEDAELLKIEGDKKAKLKKYESSIEAFGALIFWGQPSLLLIQALTNSAAIRIRLSIIESKHVPLSILECTFALEIDPKNVKALFRRGLALASVDKWEAAIVDFEKVIELDPSSPAKKELELAGMNITTKNSRR